MGDNDLSENEVAILKKLLRLFGYLVSEDEDPSLVTPQSGLGETSALGTVQESQVHENVTFQDMGASYLYDNVESCEATRMLQDMGDSELGDFLSRPIKVTDIEWDVSSPLGLSFNPWSAFFQNPRVVNRLSNFYLLRANMHVKFVINGNGFHYGRALASYLPYANLDSMSNISPFDPGSLMQMSQLPRVMLDPTTSSGGELVLPFFNRWNYIDVANSLWSELGEIYVQSINDLKHANGGTDSVTVSIFAWATDVKMSVLTSVNPTTLTPQSGSGDEIDEANKTGVISGPASSVAVWAGALSMVPTIGPFAKATAAVAASVGGLAKLFGYSRPPVTRNPEPYRPMISSSLAVTTVPDTAVKLTVDDKQELSIDPRIVGLPPADELSIRSIASRESYLTTFTWPVGSPGETFLWNTRVCPVTWSEAGTNPEAYFLPPCAMAALPFSYWTGTLKYRFQIVCSSFHKGRLRVVYDPEYISGEDYNVNYMRVVDITEEQDFTISVGNGQALTLLNNPVPGENNLNSVYSTAQFSTNGVGNGVLGVIIVNELTSPNSTIDNDVSVNVFVSAGDDFEVFVPDDQHTHYTFAATPQIGGGDNVAQKTTEPNAPFQKGHYHLGPPSRSSANIGDVFTGERIASFRALLKRYNLHSSIGKASGGDQLCFGRRTAFPIFRGGFNESVDTTILGNPYNYVNTVTLHWVRAAFSGWRGGIRYKLYSAGLTQGANRIMIERSSATSSDGYVEGVIDIPAYTSIKEVHQRPIQDELDSPNGATPLAGFLGATIAQRSVNDVMEFEVPYYSNFRFSAGKATPPISIADEVPGWDYKFEAYGGNSEVLDVYVATAEDFQLYFWTGLPRIYYEPTAPA